MACSKSNLFNTFEALISSIPKCSTTNFIYLVLGVRILHDHDNYSLAMETLELSSEAMFPVLTSTVSSPVSRFLDVSCLGFSFSGSIIKNQQFYHNNHH